MVNKELNALLTRAEKCPLLGGDFKKDQGIVMALTLQFIGKQLKDNNVRVEYPKIESISSALSK